MTLLDIKQFAPGTIFEAHMEIVFCPTCNGVMLQTSGHIVADDSHGDSWKCEDCGLNIDSWHADCLRCADLDNDR